MSNLLKEAIADAKAVRATALANAKAALEEAFQPKLEAMLAEKLKNEISDGEYGSDESSETMPMDMSASDDAMDDDAMDERMQISDDELNEILAELEGELDEAGQVDPNVPVAPAPAPVDPMAQYLSSLGLVNTQLNQPGSYVVKPTDDEERKRLESLQSGLLYAP